MSTLYLWGDKAQRSIVLTFNFIVVENLELKKRLKFLLKSM